MYSWIKKKYMQDNSNWGEDQRSAGDILIIIIAITNIYLAGPWGI